MSHRRDFVNLGRRRGGRLYRDARELAPAKRCFRRQTERFPEPGDQPFNNRTQGPVRAYSTPSKGARTDGSVRGSATLPPRQAASRNDREEVEREARNVMLGARGRRRSRQRDPHVYLQGQGGRGLAPTYENVSATPRSSEAGRRRFPHFRLPNGSRQTMYALKGAGMMFYCSPNNPVASLVNPSDSKSSFPGHSR
jgi:hypothetical protein